MASSKPIVLDRSPLRPSPSPVGTIAEAIVPAIYHERQHETWRQLCKRQLQAWRGRVDDELQAAQQCLFHDAHQIPTLAELSRRLGSRYGWRLVRVDGLVPFETFVGYLAERIFPCSDFIRDLSEVEYTNEPDMFHDLMGHLPTLNHPFFAMLNQMFGDAGLRVRTPEQQLMLEKIYWYCMEFGLINPTAFGGRRRDQRKMRAYGAGLLAAPRELEETFEGAVEIRPFAISDIVSAPIDVYKPNEFLFEVDSFATLGREVTSWLIRSGLYR